MAPFYCKKGSVKKVAIIGAGVSGLASIKACLEEDLEPVCFERSCYIGGLWSPRETNYKTGAFVYSSLIFNTSKEMTCFSDFPYPKSYPTFIRPPQQYEYLRSYADHFGLCSYVKFNKNVLRISPTPVEEKGEVVQKWKVSWQRTDQPGTMETEESIFDAVLICNGNTTERTMATFPDQEKFNGRILHSCDFREGYQHKDQKVLVIGGSNSAGDVAVECSRFARQVFLSTKKGTMPIRRLLNGGIPFDTMNTLLVSYIPNWVKKVAFVRMISGMYNLEDIGLKPIQLDSAIPATMVNDEIVPQIISGMIAPKPLVQRFTEDGVTFSDGTHEKIDTVYMATGYEMKFPFADKILAENPLERRLYLHVISVVPERPTLAVIGMTSHKGAAAPVLEMQARFAVAIFRGDVLLPSKDTMLKELEETKAALIKEHGKIKYNLFPVPYLCQLSQLMGCYPSIWTYLMQGDFKLAHHLLFKPFYPYVMRLTGKHAWSGARRAIFDARDNMFSATRSPPSPGARSRSGFLAVLSVVSCVIFMLIAISRLSGISL